jgi:cytochrome c-type protein NapC
VQHFSPLGFIALACTVIASAILLWFLLRRPPLDKNAKVALLFGLGIFPIGAAAMANIEGYKATQKRQFCGSCHVMTPIAKDSEDPTSIGLASRHARNEFSGENNCYVCHADYGMFGTVLTKMGGMRHVWLYYTEFKNIPFEEAKGQIHLLKPYPNANCMECHSTKLQGWAQQPEHRSVVAETRAGRMSCASPGCHGYAHPNMVSAEELAKAKLPSQFTTPHPAQDAGAGDSGTEVHP